MVGGSGGMSTTRRGSRTGLNLVFLMWGVRSIYGWMYLESFLAAAVASVLVIRTFLELTGFPQLGGHGLHIAHMLWGGLFMLATIVLLLTLLGQRVKRGAAILGGIGFGTFIDELGKFITSDNNYFFQPTIALIYAIFVLLFLAFRQIENWRELDSRALLANAAEVLVSGLSGGVTHQDIRHGLALLDRSGASGDEADALRRALLSLECVEGEPSLVARLEALGRRMFDRLVSAPWFHRTIVPLFIVHAVVVVVLAFVLTYEKGPIDFLRSGDRTVAAAGVLLLSVLSSALILLGIVRLPSSRIEGYRWLKRGILVSILLVQPFLFYTSQLAALGVLTIDLILLVGLDELIREARYSQ